VSSGLFQRVRRTVRRRTPAPAAGHFGRRRRAESREFPHNEETDTGTDREPRHPYESCRTHLSHLGAAVLLTHLVRDLAYALRSWRRQPAFVAIAVVSLACGIGLNTAVFGIVNAIFLQAIRGVPEPDRVVTIAKRVPFATVRALGEGATTVTGVAAWQPIPTEIRLGDLRLRTAAPVVSERYFETLGVRPFLGRFFDRSPGATPVPSTGVVLDYDFWRRYFDGDASAVGRDLVVGLAHATVIGVAPRSFHGFGPERPPLWIPMGMLPALRGTPPRWDDADESGWRPFGRLVPGVDIGQLNAELQTIAGREPGFFPDGALTATTAGREPWTGQMSPEKRIEFLLVVVLPLAVVGLILWVGCSNVATLLLARASSRRREIAIRLANGAGRGRVLQMLLVEGLLLACAGALVGLLVAAWTLDLIWLTLPEAPRLAVEIDGHVLAYTALVAVAATLFFSLAPALQATRVDVAPLLKGEEGAGPGLRDGRRTRRFFLVTQFACSTAILIVAATFVRAVVSTHVGGTAALMDHAVLAAVEIDGATPAARDTLWSELRERLRLVPGIASASVLAPASPGRLRPAGVASGETLVQVESIDGQFLETTATEVVGGRGDLDGEAGDGVEPVLVSEQAASRLWGTSAAVGRRVVLDGGTELRVAGVVRDTADRPRIFRARRVTDFASGAMLVRTAGPASGSLGAVRAALAAAGGATVERIGTLREAATGPLTRITRLASILGLTVLALATIGLYGATAFVTSLRTREIAIRAAVGAPAGAVLRLVAREALVVVGSGAALGLIAAAVAFRFMSGMIFAQWRLEPGSVLGVVTVFAAAVLVACYVPARRALRVDAMRVLRAD
jgi:putative ABC transport system permease protein